MSNIQQILDMKLDGIKRTVKATITANGWKEKHSYPIEIDYSGLTVRDLLDFSDAKITIDSRPPHKAKGEEIYTKDLAALNGGFFPVQASSPAGKDDITKAKALLARALELGMTAEEIEQFLSK